MSKWIVASVAVLASLGAANAASVINKDSEPRTLTVTEDGAKRELSIAPGETVQFCASGCFVTMPNGDREALTGSETIEIAGGAGKIK